MMIRSIKYADDRASGPHLKVRTADESLYKVFYNEYDESIYVTTLTGEIVKETKVTDELEGNHSDSIFKLKQKTEQDNDRWIAL